MYSLFHLYILDFNDYIKDKLIQTLYERKIIISWYTYKIRDILDIKNIFIFKLISIIVKWFLNWYLIIISN